MITCILLAAGLSERFGSPKPLATIGNTTVIEQIQHMLLQSACDEILVVLGAHVQKIQPSIFIHSRIRVVYNKNYNFGQLSSVQAGCGEADPRSKGVMFLPVDCPLIRSSTVDGVIEFFTKNSPDILIPTYHQKKGHPPIFHQRLKSKILNLPLNMGINSLFKEHPPITLEIDDPGIVQSFNTKEELERIQLP